VPLRVAEGLAVGPALAWDHGRYLLGWSGDAGDLGDDRDVHLLHARFGCAPCPDPADRGPEVCDGRDNDCDGEADEDGACPCEPGVVNPADPVQERWVQVCPGEFVMGSPADEPSREDNEEQHRVEITRPFLIQATEVTQGQWRAVARAEGWAVENPSFFPGDDLRPVENVNWWEALHYLNALSRAEGLAECYTDFAGCDGADPGSDQECASVSWAAGPGCEGYRLPTEAEWERAARAGGAGMFQGCGAQGEADACDGSNMETCDALNPDLDAVGVYCANDPGRPAPVGSKAANAWGLHDVHGNVWEWTWDGYATDYGGHQGLGGAVADPTGPLAGSTRVYRGGSWDFYADYARAANRGLGDPGNRRGHLGFRLARSVP
jgi:formylglycine-generating enzyme required for sulfatase activity